MDSEDGQAVLYAVSLAFADGACLGIGLPYCGSVQPRLDPTFLLSGQRLCNLFGISIYQIQDGVHYGVALSDTYPAEVR